jgi:hypothetical protein
LAESDEFAVSHKTPELDRWVHLEELAQDQMVWDVVCGLRQVLGRWIIFLTVVEGMFEIMSDKVGALEEQVNIAGKPALHAVGCSDPGSILGSRPVQLGDNLTTKLGDGVLDGAMDVAPLGRRILLFIVILLASGIRSREDARVTV